MSTAMISPGQYRFPQVARMEWVKLRTLRPALPIAAVLAAGMIGLAILVLSQDSAHWAQMSAAHRVSFDPTEEGFVGLALGQFAVGVLGALVITSEYSSGMIRATLGAIPRRGMVLAAKAAVLGALVRAARSAPGGTAGRRLSLPHRAHRPGPRRHHPAHGRHDRCPRRRRVRAPGYLPWH